MVKVIFSDFDETLLNYNDNVREISEYGFSILKKLHDNGIKFVIVTGRPIVFFNRIPHLFDFVDYVIGSNGAEIYDVQNNIIIYNDGIDLFTFNKIYDYCNCNDIDFFVNSGLKRYSYGNDDHSYCIRIDDSIVIDNINQVVFLPKDKNVFDELKYFLLSFDSIKMSNIVCNENRCSIDINNKYVSKGNSIRFLCNFLDINIKESIAFGDSDNDLSMFDATGKSICVGNSSDVIKQLVDEVIDSCDNDGVFRYIDKNIIN